MLSRYLSDEISARVKVYAVNTGDFMAFRFTIDLKNNGNFEKDFVIKFLIWSNVVGGAEPRVLQKSISRIPPGSTKALEVTLGRGEDCRNVTVEEVVIRSPAHAYHRHVILPSPTIWQLATENYRPAVH